MNLSKALTRLLAAAIAVAFAAAIVWDGVVFGVHL